MRNFNNFNIPVKYCNNPGLIGQICHFASLQATGLNNEFEFMTPRKK